MVYSGLLLSLMLMSVAYASPCNKRTSSFGIVCVCNATYCDTVEPNTKLAKGIIASYSTSQAGDRFEKRIEKFSTFSNSSAGALTFKINRAKNFQSIIGFGGAFTDSASMNIASLSSATQTNLLKSYFSNEGIEYNVGRIPMASCDFSQHVYSYDDVPNDFELKHFSLAEEDLKFKIPIIKKAQSLSPDNILLFGSPWSSPGWMKTNGNMTGGGTLKGEPGDKYYKTWANYFVRFLQEYNKQNVTIWGLTAENEPMEGNDPHYSFQCLGFTPETQRDFIALDLGPALHDNGFQDVKLMILDDQRIGLPAWPKTVLASTRASQYVSGIALHWYMDQYFPAVLLDQTHESLPDYWMLATEACNHFDGEHELGHWSNLENYVHDIIEVLAPPSEASKYVSGIALHWYMDVFFPASLLDQTHDALPDYFLLGTEACFLQPIQLGSWMRLEAYVHDIIQDLNHWVSGWTDWNLALNQQGGPSWVGNYVDSPIIVNAEKDEFYKQPTFYGLGHFSKFIPRGSLRIELQASENTDLDTVAFLTEDGATVMVVLNSEDSPVSFTISDPHIGDAKLTVQARSVYTYTWWY